MLSSNPIIDDVFVDFLLYDVLDVEALTALDHFAAHDRETFELYLRACRGLARDSLFPAYREMDEQPARYDGQGIVCHPSMRRFYPMFVELGLLTATRPQHVGGQQLPAVVHAAASAYLGGANVAAACYAALSASAAHVLESFASASIQETYMRPIYEGRWCGTMALTEAQAGSGLMDIETRATPAKDGHYLIHGAKVFISGGDNDFAENIVHLVLARIDGAPPGTRGISLFVVPKLRVERGSLIDNDVHVTGAVHKLGWRGLPSIALSFGDNDRCHGYLVGGMHQGLELMFQMMNASRLGVGSAAASTAMVAYHEALQYAQVRTQGRRVGRRSDAPVPIIQHADVRRMLLRQKAIAEGLLALVLRCYHLLDVSEHGANAEAREHATRLLDLLTPVAKTLSAELGFESNVLALQVHGGYGYASDYLPQAWLRDQKLNSIHEGTTCIQSLDLLGRKIFGTGGAIMKAFLEEVDGATASAERAGLPASWIDTMRTSVSTLVRTTSYLGAAAMENPELGLQDSVAYLELFGTIAIGWQWLTLAQAARKRLSDGRADARETFYEGQVIAAKYWFEREMPRVRLLSDVICSGDDSFLTVSAAQL